MSTIDDIRRLKVKVVGGGGGGGGFNSGEKDLIPAAKG